MEALFIIASLIGGFWLTMTFKVWGLLLSTIALIAFGYWNHKRRQGN